MPWLRFLLNGIYLIHFSCDCGCVNVAFDKNIDSEFVEMPMTMSGLEKYCLEKYFPEFKIYV